MSRSNMTWAVCEDLQLGSEVAAILKKHDQDGYYPVYAPASKRVRVRVARGRAWHLIMLAKESSED